MREHWDSPKANPRSFFAVYRRMPMVNTGMPRQPARGRPMNRQVYRTPCGIGEEQSNPHQEDLGKAHPEARGQPEVVNDGAREQAVDCYKSPPQTVHGPRPDVGHARFVAQGERKDQ
jgi:hypothetical protein